MTQPYQQHKQDVLAALSTDRHAGLTTQEAQARLTQYGPNKLAEPQRPPAWRQLAHTLREPLVLILFIAVALAWASAAYDFFVANDPAHGMAAVYESIAILLLIVINTGLSFWQAQRAAASMNALKSMAAHHATALREGEWTTVAAETLVPGDIISVKTGDFIEADVRWLQVAELQATEAHLTGEAEPIAKQTHALSGETELGDRTNMGYSEAMVTQGNGLAVVVATGMNTELGHIATLLNEATPQKTPIEKTVNALTRKLMLVALAVVLFTLALELFKSSQATGTLSMAAVAESLSTAIALAVAAIPDALPAVLAIVLTIGATMLAKNNGLIKRLNSVETLGATSFIASDKTGTLTRNQMTVTAFWANGAAFNVEGAGLAPVGEITCAESTTAPSFTRFMQAAVLNNEAALRLDENGRRQPFGNPTDVALLVMGQKAGITRQALVQDTHEPHLEIIRVLPFDSARKMMSVVIKDGPQYQVLTKGAPDVVLTRTSGVYTQDTVHPLQARRAGIEAQILRFANNALRTIAVAVRDIDADLAQNGTTAELEQDLTLLGIAGIIDPPRPEVRQSVTELHEAGVEVVMITGDHAATARAIALKLGIVSDPHAPVLEGKELNAMSDAELFTQVQTIRVYARVAPEHKQRIIAALQKHGEVVAMTGDGINDAPALRAADIGIAMGINGTEVTKDAADLILLDDKFTTIENSVRAGRTIFGNIKNFMRHELTTNVAEVLALLLGVVLMTGSVGRISATTPTLTALMVLWVNLISDALPSFALGYDVPEADLMRQAPRDPKQSILHGMIGRIFLRGIVMGTLVYAAFIWGANAGMTAAEAQTLAFLTLVFGQLWHVFDARSTKTLFRRNPFSNPKLIAAVAFAAVASLLVTVMPVFNLTMGTAPLSTGLYFAVTFLPALPTFILSGLKEAWWALHKRAKPREIEQPVLRREEMD